MPLQSHLLELERKHRAVDTKLAEALAHPSSDDSLIRDLKRQKLLIKDEISRLKKAKTVH